MGWIKSLFHLLRFPAIVMMALGLPNSFFPELSLFILFPLALIALLIWAVVGLVMSARAAWRRDWRRAAIFPVAIIVSVIAFRPANDALIWASHYAHLAWFVARDAVSPVEPDKREAGVDVFYWGAQGLAAGASEERYLLHDPERRAQKSIGLRPDPKYPGAAINTLHLAGSYYLRILYYP
jgi:hypothetical protein